MAPVRLRLLFFTGLVGSLLMFAVSQLLPVWDRPAFQTREPRGYARVRFSRQYDLQGEGKEITIHRQADDVVKRIYGRHSCTENQDAVEALENRSLKHASSGLVDGKPETVRNFHPALQNNQTCQPKTNVFYLRVHKTASTTVVSTLYMFAHHHKLDIFPAATDPFPNHRVEKYSIENRKLTQRRNFNIFAEHAVYDHKHAAYVMPTDTVRVASVRFPLSHLKSVFPEFALERRLGLSRSRDPVSEFLKHVELLGPLAEVPTRGLMCRTFGMSAHDMTNVTTLTEALSRLEKEFELVLIREYFDESMVMLRRKMCWQIGDIISVDMRQRNYRYKETPLSQELMEIHRKWDFADYVLYEHFTSVLLKEISSEENFWDEVYLYRQIKSRTEKFCVNIARRARVNMKREIYILAESNVTLQLDPRPWGQPFTVHAIECLIRQLDTRVHRNIFKVRQYPELCTSPNITRKWVNESGLFDIRWDKVTDTILIDEVYCDTIDPRYDVPLSVLTKRQMYMWSF